MVTILAKGAVPGSGVLDRAFSPRDRFARARAVRCPGPRVCDSHDHDLRKNPPFGALAFTSHGHAGLETRAPSASLPWDRESVTRMTMI